jgi:intracellular multiplication protein IcmD
MKNRSFAKKLSKRMTIWQAKLAILTFPFFYAELSHAAPATDLGAVASTLTGSFANVAKLITAGAYMAGIGFAMASMLKFKAHKDNPTQIPIGTPIALLFIGAALIFLPNIFGIAGNTIFGGTSGAGGVTGTTGL